METSVSLTYVTVHPSWKKGRDLETADRAEAESQQKAWAIEFADAPVLILYLQDGRIVGTHTFRVEKVAAWRNDLAEASFVKKQSVLGAIARDVDLAIIAKSDAEVDAAYANGTLP